MTATVVPGAAVVSTSATTSRHWSAVCTSTKTTVLRSPTSAADEATVAPSSASPSTAAGETSRTTSSIPCGQQLLGDRAPEDAEADHPHDRCLHGGHSVTSIGPADRPTAGAARSRSGQSKTQRVARVEKSGTRSTMPKARSGVTSTIRWSRTKSAFNSGSTGPYFAM